MLTRPVVGLFDKPYADPLHPAYRASCDFQVGDTGCCKLTGALGPNNSRAGLV